MSKYLIHTMPKRKWYVDEFLIPSMIKQGIRIEDIFVYSDDKGEGNLRACMNAFMLCKDKDGAIWHLQDDIIISHDFKEITEKYDTENDNIVCGFKSIYDGDTKSGETTVENMWFSFLCIRIPNKIASDCAEWVLNCIIDNPIYREWWEEGVNDDMLFRRYVCEHHKNEKAYNLKPNIVDHIDYLIGGTVNSNARITVIRSAYWTDEYLVNELRRELEKHAKLDICIPKIKLIDTTDM